MGVNPHRKRYLVGTPAEYLRRPTVRVQPVVAREGKASIDLEQLAEDIKEVGQVLDPVLIQSPEHWEETVLELGEDVDAVLPVSVAGYPTEIWNSHPRPLVTRGLPVLFWPNIEYDEPDLWRWSAHDYLQALGVESYLVCSRREGLLILRALGMRRFLRGSRMLVIGEQNFPWNATEAGHLVTEQLATRIVVRRVEEMRSRYDGIAEQQVDEVWNARQHRYENIACREEDLQQAVRTYLAIRKLCEEEEAVGFGVNCFGDLLLDGSRDTPCLAQTLLREDGYIASCDGDYLAMMSMALGTFYLDLPSMMSNMYPIQYTGALTDHFGDPLAPDEDRYPRERWQNFARLGHCAFAGVVSPEMDPAGTARLHDWGGTYEMKRDGRGCGIDGGLTADTPFTAVELRFDGRTLLVGKGEVLETTRHDGMPHCEATALLEFRDLQTFVENISREHTAVFYGDRTAEFETLARVLGLDIITC